MDGSSALQLLGAAPSWSLLVGALLPLAVAVVNRKSWPRWAKALCSIVCCVLAAAGTVWLAGSFNVHDWAGTLAVVAAAAYSSFHWVWQQAGVTQAVEAKTG